SNLLLGQPRDQTASERRALFEASGVTGEVLVNRRRGRGELASTAPTTAPSTRGSRRPFDPFAARALEFAQKEGAALVISPSMQGDGGTYFVQSAAIPGEQPRFGGGSGPSTRPRVWSTSAPAIPPQVTLATQD